MLAQWAALLRFKLYLSNDVLAGSLLEVNIRDACRDHMSCSM